MRARNIKPSFFSSPDLGECSPVSRLCFAGLWCCADREGRLLDRPKFIKAQVFPYDSIDVEPLLVELERFGLVERYEVGDVKVIAIPKFAKHQRPHVKEKPSDLPAKPVGYEQARTQVGASTDLGDGEPALNPECGILNPECGIINDANPTQVGKRFVPKTDSIPNPGPQAEREATGNRNSRIEKPEDVSDETWSDWLAHRKAKKALATPRVLEQHRNAAKQQGWTLDDALVECVVRGWTGLKAEWLERRKSRVADLSDPSWMERYPQ